jgi:hypothetical protein
MVMEYVEHDLKYVMELQKAKKVRGEQLLTQLCIQPG